MCGCLRWRLGTGCNVDPSRVTCIRLLHKVSEGSFGSLGSLDAEFLASTDSLTSPRHLNEVSPPAAARYGRGGNFGGSRPAPGGVHQKVAGGGSLPRAPSLMPKRKRRGSAAMDAIPPRRAYVTAAVVPLPFAA